VGVARESEDVAVDVLGDSAGVCEVVLMLVPVLVLALGGGEGEGEGVDIGVGFGVGDGVVDGAGVAML
jgi:hypothetical protein